MKPADRQDVRDARAAKIIRNILAQVAPVAQHQRAGERRLIHKRAVDGLPDPRPQGAQKRPRGRRAGHYSGGALLHRCTGDAVSAAPGVKVEAIRVLAPVR